MLQIHSNSCLPKIWYARYSTLTRIDGMIVDCLTKENPQLKRQTVRASDTWYPAAVPEVEIKITESAPVS